MAYGAAAPASAKVASHYSAARVFVVGAALLCATAYVSLGTRTQQVVHLESMPGNHKLKAKMVSATATIVRGC